MSKRDKWGLVIFYTVRVLKFLAVLAIMFTFTAIVQTVVGVSYR